MKKTQTNKQTWSWSVEKDHVFIPQIMANSYLMTGIRLVGSTVFIPRLMTVLFLEWYN